MMLQPPNMFSAVAVSWWLADLARQVELVWQLDEPGVIES